MTGIDISSKMIERLRSTKMPRVYSRAEVADAVEHLQVWSGGGGSPPPRLDLIVVSDAIIYFPDVPAFLRAANRALGLLGGGCGGTEPHARAAPPQMLAFSTEVSRNVTGVSMWHGRWQHGKEYIEAAVAEAGFRVAYAREQPLKQEGGNWMLGCAWVLTLPREGGVCHEADTPYQYGGVLGKMRKLGTLNKLRDGGGGRAAKAGAGKGIKRGG